MPSDHLFTSAGVDPSGRSREIRVAPTGVTLVQPVYLQPVEERQTTIAGTAASIPVPTHANYAMVQVTAAPIFWSYISLTPSATVGEEAALGDDIYLTNRDQIVNFRAIRDGGVSAVLKVAYFRQVAQGAE